MRIHIAMTAVVLLLASLASGCGTVANLAKGKDGCRVYGGVEHDIVKLDNIVDGTASQQGGHSGRCAAAFWFVDLPFSAFGDTILCPFIKLCAKSQSNAEPALGPEYALPPQQVESAPR